MDRERSAAEVQVPLYKAQPNLDWTQGATSTSIAPRRATKRKATETDGGVSDSSIAVSSSTATTAVIAKKRRFSPPKERGAATEEDDDVQIIEETSTYRRTGACKVSVAGYQHPADPKLKDQKSGQRTSQEVEDQKFGRQHSPEAEGQNSGCGNGDQNSGRRNSVTVQNQKSERHDSPNADQKIFRHLKATDLRFEDEKSRRLSGDIWEHYDRNKQPEAVFGWKMNVLDNLVRCLDHTFRFPFRLFPVGSTVNRLGSYNSDMDLCLVVFDRDSHGREFVSDNRRFAKDILYPAMGALSRIRNVHRGMVIPATVPIARFQFEDCVWSVEVDINCNNLPGIRNSHLLRYYSLVDERFPALALLVKHWAIRADINDASAGTLSSYALILMIIHYLQYGVLQTYSYARPVLPNLQALYPQIFNEDSDVRSLRLHDRLNVSSEDALSAKPLTLAELLLGFFNYYANYFDFQTSAVSVREGKVIKKGKLLFSSRKKLIGVEEPFERTNVARAVCLQRRYEMIMDAFDAAYTNLKRDMTLESIGVYLL